MSATANQRILWGAGTMRTIRAHWALHELGLNYQRRPILPRSGETDAPEFVALTARRKVPLLQDNGAVITESAAIILYLSDRYARADDRLVPEDAPGRAKCLEWCFFVMSELDAGSLYVIRRHDALRDIYGHSPVANEAAAMYFRQQMRSVELVLADGRRYILGDTFSAADMLLSTCVTWAERYGIAVDQPVLDYNASITSRPAYARARESNRPPV